MVACRLTETTRSAGEHVWYHSAMHYDDDTAFQRAIRANPADTTLKLVYADWLQEHDDLRAEFVRLQVELHTTRTPGELRESPNRALPPVSGKKRRLECSDTNQRKAPATCGRSLITTRVTTADSLCPWQWPVQSTPQHRSNSHGHPISVP